jgi:hypothetical protein
MRGIMQYNIEPSEYRFDANEQFIAKTDWTTNEVFVTWYGDYDLNVIRCTSTNDDGSINHYTSRLKISKGNHELVNMHWDGDTTALWFEQVTSKNPLKAEDKLKEKAMAIIDRLDTNSKARLYLCNRGNIVEIENLPQDVKEYYNLVKAA